ncbi:Olfactory receptor 2L5 [Fukomys damarensis]|uniref:Olfactory receptor 2L5 n=1 Tax=Fukomys damarensis TaxID=885580 RepID=A0A091DZF2_FUKDA|nr:Olfactory receptor 2L5 [Fukomys damarensis]
MQDPGESERNPGIPRKDLLGPESTEHPQAPPVLAQAQPAASAAPMVQVPQDFPGSLRASKPLTSTDFILLGLFPPSSLGLFLFTLTVPIFLMALTGNLSMVLLILLDAQLHTPMYFLLSQLSLMDLIYICTTVPKMASGFLFGNKSISFLGCGVQCFFFATLAGSEGLLLMSMSYDRYVAICFPLHYPIRMNRRVCVLMILGSWAMGIVNSCAHTFYVLHIPYCRSRAIDHFYCDIPAMLTLACGDIKVYEYFVFFSIIIFLLFPFLVILGSYGKVLLAVYRMRSQRECVLMILGSWVMGVVNSCIHTVYVLHIPYCRSRAIDHFYCDIPAMLTLACGDNRVYEYTVFLSSVLFLLLPFMVILASYGKVLLAIYRMHSREGRKKAYSTCSTHLTVVTFFYVPFVFTYLRPKSLRSPAVDKLVAVFYTILTPVLNPVIYSLRNKEVLGALRRVAGRFHPTTV